MAEKKRKGKAEEEVPPGVPTAEELYALRDLFRRARMAAERDAARPAEPAPQAAAPDPSSRKRPPRPPRRLMPLPRPPAEGEG